MLRQLVNVEVGLLLLYMPHLVNVVLSLVQLDVVHRVLKVVQMLVVDYQALQVSCGMTEEVHGPVLKLDLAVS